MHQSKRQRRRARELHAASEPESLFDCLDTAGDDPPWRQSSRSARQGRKALQLAAQVGQTLEQVLSGETGDEVLSGLRVASVAPGGGGTVVVSVTAATPQTPPAARQVEARLTAAGGWLRSLVAQAVSRKRAPRLVFRYVASERHCGVE